MQNVGHINLVRHFRVPPGPCIKTRLRAQPLIFSLSCKIKLIYTRKVVHWASFWKWGSLKPLVSPWGSLMPLVPRSLLQLSGRASELVTRSKRKSKGWRSGESARLPPMWPGANSRRRRHMWIDFVVGSLPRSRKEVFLRVLRFSPLLKNQHFQIPIRSGTHGHVYTSSYELLGASWVNKQFTIFF